MTPPGLTAAVQVLAFPLRLGLLPGSEGTIPAEYRRKIQRMEFGPKHLVNYSYFADRVSASAEPGIVFIGSRTMQAESRIEQVGTLAGTASNACQPASSVLGSSKVWSSFWDPAFSDCPKSSG